VVVILAFHSGDPGSNPSLLLNVSEVSQKGINENLLISMK
jgi:hypothetical protein